MTSFVLYRCDHCGATQDSREGWWFIRFGRKSSATNQYCGHSWVTQNETPSVAVELCSDGCLLGYVSERMIEDGNKLLPKAEKKKGRRA